jgi:hypothetical protein
MSLASLERHPGGKRRIRQHFPTSLSDLSDRREPSGRARPFRSGFEAQSGGYITKKRGDMDRCPASVADSS